MKTRLKWAVLAAACVLGLAAVPAFAECDNPEEALKTAAASQAEVAQIQADIADAMGEVREALDTRSRELGWSKEQRTKFVEGLTHSAPYLALELKRQKQTLVIATATQSLKKPEMKNDPVAVCRAGLQIRAASQQIASISLEQFDYMLQKITAAQ